MKENHFIGNILSDQHGDESQQIRSPGSYPLSRSSSAPPIMPDTPHEFKITSPVSGEQISQNDFRLNPQYAAYYYSRRPIDPRLPPPLVAPYANSQFQGFYQQNEMNGNKQQDVQKVQNPWNSNEKPKTLVDLIQQDFPRTPSPIFTQKRLGEDEDPDNPTLMGVLQPQPQPQQKAQILQRQANPMIYPDRDDLVNQMNNLNVNNWEKNAPKNANPNDNVNRGPIYDPSFAYYSYPQYPVEGVKSNVPPIYPVNGGRSVQMPDFYQTQPPLWEDDPRRNVNNVNMYATNNPNFPNPNYNSNFLNSNGGVRRNTQTGQTNSNVSPSQPSIQPIPNDEARKTKNYYGSGNSGSNPNSPTMIHANQAQALPRGPLLEEFRNNKNRKFELTDIVGHVVEFSGDQHGSRFIQEKLKTATDAEKESIFKEIIPHAFMLMKDVFGNYVIQKFFDFGNVNQKRELADQLVGYVVVLSTHMYGCRVIQKAIESIEAEQQSKLAKELEGNIMKCVRDQNGNHVIQKCIEKIPPERTQFIVDAFQGQVYAQATHPYGCRVIQRILEHCTDKQDMILDEITRTTPSLVQDQYGNYVIQHVLEHGKRKDKSAILAKMKGQILPMSQHKFASNVVEKCVEYGTPQERTAIMREIVDGKPVDGSPPLLIMMKDQYANYVIQKIIDVLDDTSREFFITKIRPHVLILKKYMYGKHIIARIEKFMGPKALG